MEKQEAMSKSLEELIDEYFGEETIEKADAETIKIAEKKRNSGERMEVSRDKEELADEAMKDVKKNKKDKEGDGGRPKEVQDVPDEDEDGKRAKGYEHVQAKQEQTPAISDKGTMVKSQEEAPEEKIEKSEDKIEVSAEEYEFLKKAKADEAKRQEEKLQKAEKEKEEALVKAAVEQATSGLKEENAELKKSLERVESLLKSVASRPVQRKSVSSVEAVEKGFSDGSVGEKSNVLTKSQMLDAAEELVMKGVLRDTDVIELENTGYISNREKRAAFERYVNSK